MTGYDGLTPSGCCNAGPQDGTGGSSLTQAPSRLKPLEWDAGAPVRGPTELTYEAASEEDLLKLGTSLIRDPSTFTELLRVIRARDPAMATRIEGAVPVIAQRFGVSEERLRAAMP